MTAVLPLAAPPAPAAPAAVSLLVAMLVSHCANCGELVAALATEPEVFTHLQEACKECFGTAGPCPYPELHGCGRPCPGAEAVECAWCHRVLEAAVKACPDHRDPCCGCCQAG